MISVEQKQERQNKNWKDLLLKSGLPFEYEVKTRFAKMGCLVYDDYSFIKSDENGIEKEFSFDIDACYWRGNKCVEFLVECKYKTEPTSWFFLPDDFSNEWEAKSTSYLHTIDHFSNEKFLYSSSPFDKVVEPIGPFCTKGTEIFKSDFIEKNIRSAINQVSYAFVEKLIGALDSQLTNEIFKNTIFFNVPIIVSNAELRLINSDLTTKDIQNAKSIEDVSTKHDFLLFHNKIGQDLKKHNYDRLSSFIFPNHVSKFSNASGGLLSDPLHFVNTVSDKYCPEVIIIMHHSEVVDNYEKLFKQIDFITQPSEKLELKTKEVNEEYQNKYKAARRHISNQKRKIKSNKSGKK